MTVKIDYTITIAKLSDWLKNPTLVSQPMRNKTKTNRILYAIFFPCFDQVTGISNSDWFIALFAPVLTSWSNYFRVGLDLYESHQSRHKSSSLLQCLRQRRSLGNPETGVLLIGFRQLPRTRT